MKHLHTTLESAMKVLKVLAIAALCLIIHVPFADATTYYVSSSQGSDTNNGTSSSTPWQTLSNVYYHSFGGRAYHPGDSILLKSGDSFDGPLTVNQGGSNGSPIIISSYGIGARPIIYGDHPSAVWSLYTNTITNTGIYSAQLGSGGDIAVSAVFDINGAQYTNSAQGARTLSNWLDTFTNYNWGTDSGVNVYVKTPDGNPPPQMHVMENATIKMSGAYHVILNLQVCHGGTGIGFGGAGNLISNNLVHDGFGTGIYANAATYSEIVSNSITNNGYTMIYLVGGGSNWCHFNTGISNGLVIMNNVHLAAGRDTSGVGMDGSSNNIVEYNYFAYMNQAFFDFYYEANSEVRYNCGFHANTGASPSGTGLKVHHNIFDLDGAGSGIKGGYAYLPGTSPAMGPTGNVIVYNNVIYNIGGSGQLVYTGNGVSNIVFRNNIFVTTNTASIMASVYAGTDMDYNLYYCTSGAPKQWSWNGAREATFANFQAASGLEAHGMYSNPQFVSANPVNTADFMIKSSSPCLFAGQNLMNAGLLVSLLAPTGGYVDYLGAFIPQGAAPSIGAYEKIGPPAPPTDLHIVP